MTTETENSKMKFTISWLKDHIDTNLDYQQISEKFVDLGIEIESTTNQSDIYRNFVTGKIVEAHQHPNSDRLCICKVDISDNKMLNIVCGAPNARQGVYVVVALQGAIVPATGFEIKISKIRGEESQGMMCSAQELCIDPNDYEIIDPQTNNCDGIIELKQCNLGKSIVDLMSLNEIILDASITPNRADCFSVRGLARDLVGSGCGTMKDIGDSKYYHDNLGNNTITNNTSVEIKTDKCQAFYTCTLANLITKTPKTISQRLKLIGQKLISPTVDIANYVCFDIGQPLHLFDLDKINTKVVVRESTGDEQITALNNNEYTIPDKSIVTGDDNCVYAISGIIGGTNTSVTQETKNIMIESGYFDKDSIAITGQALHINTDARTRFERGVDPNCLANGIMRFLQLSESHSYSEINVHGNTHNNIKTIILEYDLFAKVSGLGIDVFREAPNILKRLGCHIASSDDSSITLETPSWRHDLSIPEDAIEEVARVYGINRIDPVPLPDSYNTSPIFHEQHTEIISEYLCHTGYKEVQTFSFVDDDMANRFLMQDCSTVKIQNPINKEMGAMRNSLIISNLSAIKKNQTRGNECIKLFESGHIFYLNKDGFITEEKCISGIISGYRNSRHWSGARDYFDVFDIKQTLEQIMNSVNIQYSITNGIDDLDYYHPTRCGTVTQKIKGSKVVIGYFGELHPSIIQRSGISGPVICFELFLDRYSSCNKIANTQVSPYQAVYRDFSFVIDKNITSDKLLASIKKLNIQEILNYRIFDVYEHESIGEGKKTVGIEVVLQSQKETLKDDFIESVSDKIIKKIESDHGCILRIDAVN